MNETKTCPVCSSTNNDDSQLCDRCGWEFPFYVSGISKQEEDLYNKKLSIARNNWLKLLNMEKKIKHYSTASTKKDKITQDENKQLKEKGINNEIKKESISKNEIENSQETDISYSTNTKVPELKRDPFDTHDEFKELIDNYPPVPAGKLIINKQEFSVHIGEFPVKLELDEWTKKLDIDLKNPDEFCVHIPQQYAMEFYQDTESHLVFIKLKSNQENEIAIIDKIEIFWKNQAIPVEYYSGIMEIGRTETKEEYKKRIDNYGFIPAGFASLIKTQYDYRTKKFPVEIKIDQWIQNIFNYNFDNPYIIAKRDIAKEIYQKSKTHTYPIKIKLNVIDNILSTEKIHMFADNSQFEIQNIKKDKIKFLSKNEVFMEPNTKMEFIYVPGGTFKMGDVFGDGYTEEKPVHDVQLDEFYMGKYPVTQGQWEQIMGNNPSNFKKGKNYPVENVSWDDAHEFITKLNNLNKEKFTFRLPAEAEWEYAARSGGKKEKYSGSNNIDEVAWYGKNSKSSTHPVGEKLANGLGLYDMSGKVLEWCEDIYDENAYDKHELNNPIILDGNSGLRVLRGGSWSYDARNCRVFYRNWDVPGNRFSNYGFRLVFSPRSVNK